MARIRGKHTRPELLLRKALWAAGLRYRLHRKLPGTPDLAFVGARVAVFVDGCFWHGCPQHYSFPATRSEFWADKLRRNVERDARVGDELAALGWTVLRFWEHSLRTKAPAAADLATAVAADLATAVATVREAVVGAPAPPLHVAEAVTAYAAPPLLPTPWYACGRNAGNGCGSEDVQVLAVSNPGGLSPRAKRPIERATLRCRACRLQWESDVGFTLTPPGHSASWPWAP